LVGWDFGLLPADKEGPISLAGKGENVTTIRCEEKEELGERPLRWNLLKEVNHENNPYHQKRRKRENVDLVYLLLKGEIFPKTTEIIKI